MTICIKTTAYVPSFGMSAAGAPFAIAGTRAAVAQKWSVRPSTDLGNAKHEGTRAWRNPRHR